MKSIETKEKSIKGISLISLIITIIVLLILAGVVLNMLIGENGIIPKAQFSKLSTNVRSEDERQALEKQNREIKEKTENGNKSKIASLEIPSSAITSEKAEDEETYYKVKGKRLDNEKLDSSLKETIKYIDGVTDEDFTVDSSKVKLYQVDNDSYNEVYILNTVTGKTYQYKALSYKGLQWHRPEQGYNEETGELEGREQGITIITQGQNTWTSKSAKTKVSIKLSKEYKGKIEDLRIEYSKDQTTWNEYTEEIESNKNEIIYIRVRNEITNAVVAETTKKVNNIDNLEPTISDVNVEIRGTSFVIKVTASDQEETSESGKSDINKYEYYVGGVKRTPKVSDPIGQCTVEGLSNNTEYEIYVKVYDNANNYKESDIQKKTTTTAVLATKINFTAYSLDIGEEETLTATITPTNASIQDCEWSIDNEDVATLEIKNGVAKIIGKSIGTLKITAKTIDGSNKTVTKTIYVRKFNGVNITRNTSGSNGRNLMPNLFDDVKTNQGTYGACLMYKTSSNYILFDVAEGGRYITFSTGKTYSDSAGSSGKTARFYKLNKETNKYEAYINISQKNNTKDYTKTFFEEGSYKVAPSAPYVKFDEWTVTTVEEEENSNQE